MMALQKNGGRIIDDPNRWAILSPLTARPATMPELPDRRVITL
jgi:hypothetical protein